jgi:hypothetical protein
VGTLPTRAGGPGAPYRKEHTVTLAAPFLDIAARDLVGRWTVDLETDCGERESLSLTIGRNDLDARLLPVNVVDETRVEYGAVTTTDLRDLAAALVRVADAMDAAPR